MGVLVARADTVWQFTHDNVLKTQSEQNSSTGRTANTTVKNTGILIKPRLFPFSHLIAWCLCFTLTEDFLILTKKRKLTFINILIQKGLTCQQFQNIS